MAMITTPRGNASQACRSAVRRICLDWMLVSETWNVMADREGQVGEVAIVGVAGVVEVDPPGVPGVVQARVSQREHRVDEGPGQKDGDQRETCQQVLGDSAGMTYPGQDYAHGDQAGARRGEQYRICQGGCWGPRVGRGPLSCPHRASIRWTTPRRRRPARGCPSQSAAPRGPCQPPRRPCLRPLRRPGIPAASSPLSTPGEPSDGPQIQVASLQPASLPACQPVARRRRAGDCRWRLLPG